ncbi:hypothetical protein BGZ73_008451 [Actinomortierella ambigua]|nr:hypothetical protein BGZ73_008451 [Actinomortierella ambigua]
MAYHSRAANVSDDLEHVELTEEVAAAHADESPVEDVPPLPSRNSRRVSINSVGSNESNSTIKYHKPSATDHVVPMSSGSTSGHGAGGSSRPHMSSSTSYSSASSKRNKPPYRHSSALLGTYDHPPSSSSSRRRRPSASVGKQRPGSSRSSIHQRNRSSEEDEDEDDEDDEEGTDEYNNHPHHHHQHHHAHDNDRASIADRRSQRYDSDDQYDSRSTHSRLRRANSRRSTRISPGDDGEEHQVAEGEEGGEEDDSDVEPLTLKDRQETLNQTHPFGLPLWKPALYKKSRSVIRKANSALHSQPSSELYLSVGNVLWTLLFGWWMSLASLTVALLLYLVPCNGRSYGRVLLGLSYYLFWPFGQYVERELLPGDSRSVMHSGYPSVSSRLSQLSPHDESRPLLSSRSSSVMDRDRLITKRKSVWTRIAEFPGLLKTLGAGGIVYYILYIAIIGPILLIVSCLCWFMVISIPMGKFTYVLATHLWRHPLRLNFKRGSSLTLSPQRSEILLCTYDAIGLQYYKYTYDGTNIIFINLMPVVFFTIIDDYFLTKVLGHDTFITTPAFIFSMGLASVIPLSYFIGMAVSSISAQSSLGMGAVINATFGSIIEIILYTVALTQGKGLITEGALIGSFFAGLLLMPGVSMMGGAVKKKEQKFNVKSAGVTATMLIMALIGVLTPTLFYNIYGRFEIRCSPCPETTPAPEGSTCSRCYQHQPNPADDAFFQTHVKPLMYFCCIILPTAYLVGIWFSLRTHVKQIWHEPQHNPARDSSIYKKLLPIHIVQQLLHYGTGSHHLNAGGDGAGNHANRPTSSANDAELGQFMNGHQVPNYQSTSNGAVGGGAAQGATAPGAGAAVGGGHYDGSASTSNLHPGAPLLSSFNMDHQDLHGLKHDHFEEEEGEEHVGHDSPNWSKAKSATVLLGCTVLYSIIAEILVDAVDAVSSIDEKLLGLTLFALVPNVTEFMNAISFAMYGNIALSMEIGSAYALQVCLIQIPAMVAVSAWLHWGEEHAPWNKMFNLIFPRWDVFGMLFSVFLLTYTYIEGKSNYFKGSILILSYFVLMAGFVFAPGTPENGDMSFVLRHIAGEL